MEFVERHEWVGPDVWFAHMVHLSDAEVAFCARTGTGIAHCPQSNGRLGSGIARVPELLRAGAPVSLAVDGAASNEAADMQSEAHACWLLHRADPRAGSTSAAAQPGGKRRPGAAACTAGRWPRGGRGRHHSGAGFSSLAAGGAGAGGSDAEVDVAPRCPVTGKLRHTVCVDTITRCVFPTIWPNARRRFPNAAWTSKTRLPSSEG